MAIRLRVIADRVNKSKEKAFENKMPEPVVSETPDSDETRSKNCDANYGRGA